MVAYPLGDKPDFEFDYILIRRNRRHRICTENLLIAELVFGCQNLNKLSGLIIDRIGFKQPESDLLDVVGKVPDTLHFGTVLPDAEQLLGDPY